MKRSIRQRRERAVRNLLGGSRSRTPAGPRSLLPYHVGPRWKALSARGAHPQRSLGVRPGPDPRTRHEYLDCLIGRDHRQPCLRDAGRLSRSRPPCPDPLGGHRRGTRAGRWPRRARDRSEPRLPWPAGGRREGVCRLARHVARGHRRSPRGHRRTELRPSDVPVDARRFAPLLTAAVAGLAKGDAPARLWKGDPTLFTSDPRTRSRSARGWYGCAHPSSCAARSTKLRSCPRGPNAGFKPCAAGDGGSSLCPEVLAQTFRCPRGVSRSMSSTTRIRAVRAVDRAGPPRDHPLLVRRSPAEPSRSRRSSAYFWVVC